MKTDQKDPDKGLTLGEGVKAMQALVKVHGADFPLKMGDEPVTDLLIIAGHFTVITDTGDPGGEGE